MWKVPVRVGRAGRPVATTVVATTLPLSYAVRLWVARETTISLPGAPGVGAGVGGGVGVGVGRGASDSVGSGSGAVVGSGVGSMGGVEIGATTGGLAALVSSVLRKIPPMSPKRMKTLMVDPIRITARLVIAFPSCLRLPTTWKERDPVGRGYP